MCLCSKLKRLYWRPRFVISYASFRCAFYARLEGAIAQRLKIDAGQEPQKNCENSSSNFSLVLTSPDNP